MIEKIIKSDRKYFALKLGTNEQVDEYNLLHPNDTVSSFSNYCDSTSSDYLHPGFFDWIIKEIEKKYEIRHFLSEFYVLVKISEPEIAETKYQIEWLHNDHYHCKECNGNVDLKFADSGDGEYGVIRVGFCKRCKIMLIETERGGLIWRKLIG